MTKTRYKIGKDNYPYFITSTVVEWLPLLTKKPVDEIILEILDYMQNHNRITILAYVIMPTHIHFIATSQNLPKEVANFNSFSARTIIDHFKTTNQENILEMLAFSKPDYKIDRTYQFWQEGGKPKQIFNLKIMQDKVQYIHYNPVRKGLVEKSSDWLYSSAGNYIDGTGLIDVVTDWAW
ncbi:MAG: transposase [Candidatus Marinimicrobia bacterium]|nr:transposase [bacterium]MCG2714882.1 transposase [Candidatus Neomarinimicrobiota bacterium]